MVIIVVLRSRRMKFKIALFIVCFLKQDVRSDAGIFQPAIVLDGSGGDIYVYTADSSILVSDTINGPDGFQYILQ